MSLHARCYLLASAAVLVTTALASACGSDDVEVFDTANDGGAGGFGEGGSAEAGEGGSTVTCGTAQCTSGQGCVGGQCVCAPYTTFCDGKCIPTVSDPENCGGCGVKCTGALACSGGTCSADCLPGLDKCGNACVDTKSDNTKCGGCSATACAAGTGCVDGACHPVVPTTGSGPPGCAGSGASPTVDPAQGGCLATIAQTVFRWAVCSCKDAQFSGDYLMDGYDSTAGPYKPGGLGASFGANENYGTSGTGELWGTMWIAGTGGIAPSLTHIVKTDTRSGGELKSSSTFTIGSDAHVLGNVSGSVNIGGKLFLPAGKSASGGATYGSLVQPHPVAVPPPCDFCAPAQQVPIAAIVAAHRSPSNDNASIGLNPDAFASPTSPLRLDLPCGHYFLSRIASSNHVAIVAHGRTALYIDGDVNPNGITFAVDPGGELNVFVTGSLATSGVVRIGSPAYPAVMRVYVAGAAGFSISDTVRIGGNLYVPNGAAQYSSQADQYGAIYAGNFSTSKDLAIHYDRAVVTAGVTCPVPPGSGGGSSGGSSGSSGGGMPAPCGTCKDCGNQACVNGTCGTCSASDQCCPPLVCSNGSCVNVIK